MTDPIKNETIAALLDELGVDPSLAGPSLQALGNTSSRYCRDLKINVSSTLASIYLTPLEASLIALSVAVNEKHAALIAAFEERAKQLGAIDDVIAETHGCASLLSMNNVLYRFRHFMGETDFYKKNPTGLRMSLMMNPTMGKQLFELISLVISAVNGCETCVVAHEHSVKALGASELRIFDAVRLGSVIRGLCIVL